MHWLWSYVMCLSRRWGEMAARANIRRRSVAAVHLGGRPCRVSNAATRHSVTNNAWMISLFQTLLFVRAPNQGAAGGHQRHRVNQPLKYLSKDEGEAHLPGQFLLQRSKSDLRECDSHILWIHPTDLSGEDRE